VWEADHRTHRKILVVDESVAFTGGVGIAEEWEGDARNPDEWRDTHVRLEGPAVIGLRSTFLTDWRDGHRAIDPADLDVDIPDRAGDVPVAVIDGSAQIGLNEAARVLEAVVAVATTRIRLCTPYFNPKDGLHDRLAEAARRGVDVAVLVPGPYIDKRVSSVAAAESYAPLLDAGVAVWRYQPTMLHTKAVLVDGALSLLGSVNVNRRSAEKDEEVAIAVLDHDVTEVLESHFEEDVARSVPVEASRGWRRFLGRLVKPVEGEL
jgi:cardiolipin synthase